MADHLTISTTSISSSASWLLRTHRAPVDDMELYMDCRQYARVHVSHEFCSRSFPSSQVPSFPAQHLVQNYILDDEVEPMFLFVAMGARMSVPSRAAHAATEHMYPSFISGLNGILTCPNSAYMNHMSFPWPTGPAITPLQFDTLGVPWSWDHARYDQSCRKGLMRSPATSHACGCLSFRCRGPLGAGMSMNKRYCRANTTADPIFPPPMLSHPQPGEAAR